MNSLELYNQFYQSQTEPNFDKSLLHFFKRDVEHRLNLNTINTSPFRILDIGCGSQSLFEMINFNNVEIFAVDSSQNAIDLALTQSHSKIKYQNVNITIHHFTDFEFDLIFDSHCLHCIHDQDEREFMWKSLYKSLKNGGIVASEMMVQPTKKRVHFPFKYIPPSIELEQEILSYGFKIKFLYVETGRVFYHGNEECDLVKLILEK